MSPARLKYLIGLFVVVGLAAAVLAWRNHQGADMTVPAVNNARPAAAIQADWRQGVIRILAEYDQTQDAKAAQDGLLALHVTQPDQTVHLELVLALQALSESKADGKAMLRTARSHFDGGETVVR